MVSYGARKPPPHSPRRAILRVFAKNKPIDDPPRVQFFALTKVQFPRGFNPIVKMATGVCVSVRKICTTVFARLMISALVFDYFLLFVVNNCFFFNYYLSYMKPYCKVYWKKIKDVNII